MSSVIYGVGLVLHCRTTNKFLILRELQDKRETAKKAGMLSIPFETRQELEIGWKKTAVRALREELGINLVPNDVPDTVCLNPLTPVEFDYGTGWKSRVYFVGLSYDHEFRALPEDVDIEHCGWLGLNEIGRMVDDQQMRFEMEGALRFMREMIESGANA